MIDWKHVKALRARYKGWREVTDEEKKVRLARIIHDIADMLDMPQPSSLMADIRREDLYKHGSSPSSLEDFLQGVDESIGKGDTRFAMSYLNMLLAELRRTTYANMGSFESQAKRALQELMG